ncbi:MAG: hypothetical protein GY913_24460 [Proteobacteria bacterium]|nr:hypothetical protein [Pseudomonadota bacterium]MCP4920067.1 hypothetical protein [Pseudomonadota bacterium]
MGTPTRIRGATPAGLAWACELARRGCEVEVSDPRSGPAHAPLVLGPRGQEHWHHLGVPLGGHRLHGLTLTSDRVRVAHLSMDELDTPFPFLTAVPEGETRLLAFAEQLGVRVLWERGAEVEQGPRVGWTAEMSIGGVADDEVHLGVDDDGLLGIVPLGEGRARLQVEGTMNRPDGGDWTRWLNARGPAGAWVREAGEARPVRRETALWCDTEEARNRGWAEALVATGRGHAGLAQGVEVERRALVRRLERGRRFVPRVVALRQPVPRDRVGWLVPHLARWEPVQERVARLRADLHVGYRDSPWVGEDRDPLLLARVGRDDRAETPTLAGYLDFSGGPVPGDRAPDAPFGAGGGRRLRQALRGHRHGLLLFDGLADTDDGYRVLGEIAQVVEERFGDVVAACVVVPSERRPPALGWDGPMLSDPDFTLHTAFGARSECLYLIRPDGFVGYRSQPAQLDGLLRHLARIFV